jgi:hypothetical protein
MLCINPVMYPTERRKTMVHPDERMPFSLLYAIRQPPVQRGDETAGAETETQTSRDGIVKTDTEEDGDEE